MVDTNTNTLPPVTDARSAALHIERLLDLGDDDDAQPAAVAVDNESADTPSDEEVEVDAAPDDEPASQDEDDGQDETDDGKHLPIEPPTSWNASDKAKFKELPLDLQQVVARREGERDKAIQTRMNQLADERKAIEAHVQQANQAQTQYANTLNQLLTLTIPELQEIEQTDWLKLSQTDPAECVRRQAVQMTLRQRVGFMQQQIQAAQQAQNAQQQQQQQARLADQYQQLVSALPEFAEPAKAKVIVSDIAKAMEPYGFSQEELGSVADARIVKVLHRLTQLEKAEAARKSAVAKKGATPAPKMMPANAAPVRDRNPNRKIAEQFAQLRKSGSGKDAARLIENIL
jgi:hypothetical protein